MRRLRNEHLYEARATEFAAHSETSKFNALYERPAMLQRLGDPSGKSILDIGCGAAPLLRCLEGLGARRLVGIEASPGLARLARSQVTDAVTIHQGDAVEVLSKLAESEFDVIVASLVIHYIDPLEPLFQGAANALVDDGRLLMSTNVPVSEASSGIVYEYWPTLNVEVSRFDQSERSLRRNLAAAGFDRIAITNILPSREMREAAPETYARLVKNPAFVLIEARLRRPGDR